MAAVAQAGSGHPLGHHALPLTPTHGISLQCFSNVMIKIERNSILLKFRVDEPDPYALAFWKQRFLVSAQSPGWFRRLWSRFGVGSRQHPNKGGVRKKSHLVSTFAPRAAPRCGAGAEAGPKPLIMPMGPHAAAGTEGPPPRPSVPPSQRQRSLPSLLPGREHPAFKWHLRWETIESRSKRASDHLIHHRGSLLSHQWKAVMALNGSTTELVPAPTPWNGPPQVCPNKRCLRCWGRRMVQSGSNTAPSLGAGAAIHGEGQQHPWHGHTLIRLCPCFGLPSFYGNARQHIKGERGDFILLQVCVEFLPLKLCRKMKKKQNNYFMWYNYIPNS